MGMTADQLDELEAMRRGGYGRMQSTLQQKGGNVMDHSDPIMVATDGLLAILCDLPLDRDTRAQVCDRLNQLGYRPELHAHAGHHILEASTMIHNEEKWQDRSWTLEDDE